MERERAHQQAYPRAKYRVSYHSLDSFASGPREGCQILDHDVVNAKDGEKLLSRDRPSVG